MEEGGPCEPSWLIGQVGWLARLGGVAGGLVQQVGLVPMDEGKVTSQAHGSNKLPGAGCDLDSLEQGVRTM